MKILDREEFEAKAVLSTNTDLEQIIHNFLIFKIVIFLHIHYFHDHSSLVRKTKCLRWSFKRRVDKVLEISYYQVENMGQINGK